MIGLRTAAQAIRKRLRPADGISLIEMLVVLVCLVIVVGAMTALFVSASKSQIDQTNRVESQQEARLALDALRREIHCAKAVAPDPIPVGGAALINITLGPYCTNGGTTLTSALTIPASGSYTVNAADTSPFAAAGIIFVGEASGIVTCTGKTPTSFTGCTGGVAGPYASGSAVTGTTTVTWCTKDKNGTSPPAAASSPYSLWRYRGSTCSGTGRIWADNLTETTTLPAVAAGKIFVGYSAAEPGKLRALTIALPVDVTPDDALQRYLLRDDIALRNSPRS